ncbi:MAG: PepSY domain-containing protein [Chloroflexi bacterium]|nr:PepSY domain-containing protein [Chloroflexota bacterium]
MKRTVLIATLLALVALAALAVPTFAQGPMGRGMMDGNGRGFGFGSTQSITPTGPFNGYGMMGGGMMGGYGFGPNQTITPTVPFGNYGSYGMMGGRGGYGMMGGYGYGYAPNATPIKIDDAIARAKQYVAAYNNPDLKLAEVEEYAANFYGVVVEKSTGTGAFQILIDKFNGAVYLEMGPNMMWNTKYSPMGGMMGGFGFNQPSGKMTVTVDQARANAEQYVKANLPNATVEKEGDTFYGYYNFDVVQNGNTYGMLSVNGYTGAVWYHTWHGNFVAKKTVI